MQHAAFSSDSLPAELDGRLRFRMWQDVYRSRHGHLDLAQAENAPLPLRFEFAAFGAVGLGQFDGSFNRITRNAQRIAARPSDTFCLVLNRSHHRLTYFHRRHENIWRRAGSRFFATTKRRSCAVPKTIGWPLSRSIASSCCRWWAI